MISYGVNISDFILMQIEENKKLKKKYTEKASEYYNLELKIYEMNTTIRDLNERLEVFNKTASDMLNSPNYNINN